MSYKSYPLFKDIEDRFVRAYNLLQIAENIRQDIGAGAVQDYMKQIDNDATGDMAFVIRLIKTRGLEYTIKQVQARIKGEAYEDSDYS